ncbi:hypothetical protein HHK36_003373 [Tetracentron sinense]|uniref:Major facilitator superfamily (MFS) profile domain-containing protein n=1 Tax=Tetracentron sinense TaxID=13715 RepID=A0A835DP95_TETSI|nr:hypothetical protein HHK36_003373 [Tetracentron sinense]
MVSGNISTSVAGAILGAVLGGWINDRDQEPGVGWLGVGGVSALFQYYVLMFSLPDSARWLYRKKKKEERVDILKTIYPTHEVDKEMKALQSSVEDEIAKDGYIGGGDFFTEIEKAMSDDACRGIKKGYCYHLAQQILSLKAVIYCSPAVVEMAGFSSNKAALDLPLIISGLGVVGSIVSITFVDRIGRRMTMFLSLNGTIIWIWFLYAVFSQALPNSPVIGRVESIHFGVNSTCSSY